MKKQLDRPTTQKIPAPATKLIKKFNQAGFEIYLVGGAVRDLLLNRPITDCDFTTNAQPEKIQAILPDSFYDNRFGTVGLVVNNSKYEITTYRTEQNYADHRHPSLVNWGKSLAEDLQRRDFTVNAMAIGFAKARWELIDLYSGQKDLEDKTIRAVGDPRERFREDALRLVRAVRLASQLGFTLEKKTWAAISENAKLLADVSAERIREELFKIVVAAQAEKGVDLLRTTSLLDLIIPELTKAYGVAQAKHHLHDVWTHSLLSLKHCPSQDPITRLAALIHDVGKPYVAQGEGEERTFHNHELVSTKIAYRLAKRLKFSKDQEGKLVTLVRWHQFTVDERQTDSAIKRFIRRVGQENLEEMLNLRVGDRLGGGARETSWRLEKFKKRLTGVQKQPFSVTDLKINGHDVMQTLKIKPGPKVGQILEELFKQVEANQIPNEREVLLQRLKDPGR